MVPHTLEPGDWWERGPEVAGFFGEKSDLGEFERKVTVGAKRVLSIGVRGSEQM